MKFFVCDEMKKLRDKLDANNIPWEDVSDMWEGIDWWMCRTHFEYMDYFWSVIHGYGSYGGINPGCDKGGQLLEVASDVFSGTIGSCTAEEIWEMMQKIAHKRSGNEKQRNDCEGCIYFSKAKRLDGEIATMCSYISRTTAWACCREEGKGDEKVRGKGLRKL